MVALSLMVTARVLALIPSEDANSMVLFDLLLLLPRKTHRTSHQRQVDRQNEWKREEVFVQAFV
jgi:hypothetical protein